MATNNAFNNASNITANFNVGFDYVSDNNESDNNSNLQAEIDVIEGEATAGAGRPSNAYAKYERRAKELNVTNPKLAAKLRNAGHRKTASGGRRQSYARRTRRYRRRTTRN